MKHHRTKARSGNHSLRILTASFLLGYGGSVFAGPNPYNQKVTAFESGQVRPLAITPDAKLEIFKTNPNGLDHRVSVPVGLEPVSVAVRNNGEKRYCFRGQR